MLGLIPQVNVPDWAVYTAEAIVGLGVILTAWFKVCPKLKLFLEKRSYKKSVEAVLKNARILRHMNLLIREWLLRNGAHRVLILYAKNGGKPWRAEDKVKVSCLDQVVAQGEPNTWERWQDWVVDPLYRDLLMDVLLTEETQRGVLLNTDSMENCVLKDAYKAQGTAASVVFPIHWVSEENGLVYVSINFGNKLEEKVDEETGKVNKVDMPYEDIKKYEKMARDLFNSPEEIRTMAQLGKREWKGGI